SFDPSLLVYLRDQGDFPAPVPLGLITWLNFPVWHALPAAAGLGLDAVCLHIGSFALHREQPRPQDHTIEKVISVAHQAGLEVLAWCPAPEAAVRLAAAGADALSVNDVPEVVAALAGVGPAAVPQPPADRGPIP
ncbi:MAG: hypothetical protein J2P35_16140, partial [Actinobacteria bacterium]|nr:hypothetical protein [Actinomycetota bacterium]